MSAGPWNDWYHCIGSTYGTWLPGDPRGFRTRHHREHIEGDYRNPPPAGMYEKRFQHSKELMKRDPVYLTTEQRTRAVQEFVKSLRKRQIQTRAISIDRIHFHVLARFPNHDPRTVLGLAKKESSAYMKQDHLAPQGGLWGIRFLCKPVNDESHFHGTARYILQHAHKGAATWDWTSTNDMSDFDPDRLLIDR